MGSQRVRHDWAIFTFTYIVYNYLTKIPCQFSREWKVFYKCFWSNWVSLWQEYTELYKKDLHDPDNHDGMSTHLEPDILECEVKWALESITTNKASGVDEIPVEIFQILKDDAVKYASTFGKLSSGHRTGKGLFSFQSQRKAIPKNAQTTTQLHSSHTLVK